MATRQNVKNKASRIQVDESLFIPKTAFTAMEYQQMQVLLLHAVQRIGLTAPYTGSIAFAEVRNPGR